MPSSVQVLESMSIDSIAVEDIRVLIVEPAAQMQSRLLQIFSEETSIRVVGAAFSGAEALAKIALTRPHVVTMEAKLPDMTGVKLLRDIRRKHPRVRVVMCSVSTTRGAKATLDALMAGASHCVAKPDGTSEYAYAAFAEEMLRKVCLHRELGHAAEGGAKGKSYFGAQNRRRTQVLAIGSSMGGAAALAEVLPMLPAEFGVPVLIAQNMPVGVTRELAERLSAMSRIEVIEAEDGMEVRPGVAVLAPGGHSMRVVRRLDRVEIALAPESGSSQIDGLFRSVAEAYGRNAVAAVLTGAGQDGVQGAGVLKALGNPVVVQDQASSVAWEMPKAIVDAGLADAVLPLGEIVPAILRYVVTGEPKAAPEAAVVKASAAGFEALPQTV